MKAAVQVDVGSCTDVGLKRAINEDAHLAAFPVFLVADGMGGHEAGDQASAAAVEAFQQLVSGAESGREVTAERVVEVIAGAQRDVKRIADNQARGAGSTLTGMALVQQAGESNWLVFNVGDSRVYRCIDSTLTQLTIDHSIAQELVDEGRLRHDEMTTFKGRNVITRALGSESSEPDFWIRPVVDGERLMACSDGLTGEVTDEQIHEVLSSRSTPAAAAQRLVNLALAHGGRDNVTVVVVDVISGGQDRMLEGDTGVVIPGIAELDDSAESTAPARRRRG